MHKLKHPTVPDDWESAVREHCKTYLPASQKTETRRWQAFRDIHDAALKAAQCSLQKNQHHICAYCEMSTEHNNHQIEHFFPKSQTSEASDLTFMFSNFLLCCKGGTNKFSSCGWAYCETPSAKENHTCGESKKDINPRNACLNPYELPDFCIFTFKYVVDEGIYLVPNNEKCRLAGISEEIISSTIDILNLNCYRLRMCRDSVWDEISNQVMKIKSEYLQKTTKKSRISEKIRTPQKLKELVKSHLKKRHPLHTTAFLCIKHLLPHLLPMKFR